MTHRSCFGLSIPIAAAAAIALAGCGGGSGGGTASPGLAALVSGAADIVRASHPGARLIEAHGLADRGHPAAGPSQWNLVFSLTADPGADTQEVMVRWRDGAYSPPIEAEVPTGRQVATLPDALPMALDAAVLRLRSAGCTDPYMSVRYWQPPASEPVFAFQIPPLRRSVTVGALSGRVSSPLLAASDDDSRETYQTVIRNTRAVYRSAHILRAVGRFVDGMVDPDDAAVAAWDFDMVDPRDPGVAIAAGWSAVGGYTGPTLNGSTPTEYQEVRNLYTDPVWRWADLCAFDFTLIKLRAEGPVIPRTGTLRQLRTEREPFYIYELVTPEGTVRVGADTGTTTWTPRPK